MNDDKLRERMHQRAPMEGAASAKSLNATVMALVVMALFDDDSTDSSEAAPER